MKIDFVITWVDGNDINWQKEKIEYDNTNKKGIDNSLIRYRDWDNLRYWFRGVEEYANWVNKIYFVTWGHYPEWLNLDNPKLVVINHEEYIPKKYLPTFNSTTIELNLNKIKELSEHFVLFNDDMFLINSVKESDFFKNGLPKETAIINPIIPQGEDDYLDHHKLNNIDIINKYFSKKDVYKNLNKIFNISYGKNMIRSLFSIPYPKIPGFKTLHYTTPILKSVMDEIWQKEYKRLDTSCKNKFRTKYDYNQYLFKYWQIASNKYYPQRYNFGYYHEIKDENDELLKIIKNDRIKILCLNDSDEKINFEIAKENLNHILENKLPNKSSFEKF